MNKISVDDSAVPFVITYRNIKKKPKVARTRKFVGAVQLFKNLLINALDYIDNVAFETNTKIIDPGVSTSVHWAVNIADPWDISPGRETNLIAYRMLDDVPPSALHFEIISNKTEPADSESKPKYEHRFYRGSAAEYDNNLVKGMYEQVSVDEEEY